MKSLDPRLMRVKEIISIDAKTLRLKNGGENKAKNGT